MNIKNKKMARKFFVYGLILGLFVGVLLSIIGVPQTVGNSIRIKYNDSEQNQIAKELDFKTTNKIKDTDLGHKEYTLIVSGKLNPEDDNFEKQLSALYDYAIKKLEGDIYNIGPIDCKTKEKMSKEQIKKNIDDLKNNKKDIQNILDIGLKKDIIKQVREITNGEENNLKKESKNNNTKNINFSGTINNNKAYLECPPDCGPLDPPGGDGGNDSGTGVDWIDGFIDFVDGLPDFSCSDCAGSGYSCISGVCVGGGADVGSCIVEGQSVLLANNQQVLVENLNIGDKIKSYNLNTKQLENDTILAKIKTSHKEYCLINNNLKLSTNHKVYVVDKGFVEAQDLTINKDTILQNKKPTLVTSKEIIEDSVNSYSFTVEKNGNLIVNDILVTNLHDIWGTFKVSEVRLEFTIEF
jgi:hypothetical protein